MDFFNIYLLILFYILYWCYDFIKRTDKFNFLYIIFHVVFFYIKLADILKISAIFFFLSSTIPRTNIAFKLSQHCSITQENEETLCCKDWKDPKMEDRWRGQVITIGLFETQSKNRDQLEKERIRKWDEIGCNGLFREWRCHQIYSRELEPTDRGLT